MSRFLFPDNTVLCNFAAVDRLDLLENFLRGRGRWTEAVAAETEASARILPALGPLVTAGWLGDPIVVDRAADIAAVELVRLNVFGGRSSRRTEHLGEAQTCHVIATWKEFAGSVWISDDRASLDFADARGMTAWETIDIVRCIIADGDLTPQAAYDVMIDMADADRALTLPNNPGDLR